MQYLLKNGRVVDPRVGLDSVADVLVDNGVISAVGHELPAGGSDVIDCAGRVVVPGLIDIHVHLREPGFEYKETIETGTAAAAHGGFVGVCCMANTSPVTDTATAVRSIIEAAEDAGHARVWPIGAVTLRQDGRNLVDMADLARAGAVAFSDDGHGLQSSGVTRTALEYASMLGTTILSHAEDDSLVGSGCVNEGVVSTRLGLPGQPAIGESVAAIRDIEIAGYVGGRVHVCHVSSRLTVDAVRSAKARGIAVTAEVTPHHLLLTEDALTGDYDTNLKMNPPLRTQEDRLALLQALRDGVIDAVASDHAPHAPHEKEVEFELAAYGTTGLETALPILLSEFVKPGLLDFTHLVERMAHGPRECVGLPLVTIEPGQVADITIIDPERTITVTPDWFESKGRNSAFLGQTFTGCATDVLVGGRFTLRDGKVVR